jgi:hypothetical protein
MNNMHMGTPGASTPNSMAGTGSTAAMKHPLTGQTTTATTAHMGSLPAMDLTNATTAPITRRELTSSPLTNMMNTPSYPSSSASSAATNMSSTGAQPVTNHMTSTPASSSLNGQSQMMMAGTTMPSITTPSTTSNGRTQMGGMTSSSALPNDSTQMTVMPTGQSQMTGTPSGQTQMASIMASPSKAAVSRIRIPPNNLQFAHSLPVLFFRMHVENCLRPLQPARQMQCHSAPTPTRLHPPLT